MAEKVALEWSYTPADFFEELVVYNEKDYTVEIKNGRVVATFPGAADEQAEDLFQEIQAELNACFLGAQLVSNKPYRLSGYTTTRTRADGTTEIGACASDTLNFDAMCDAVVRDAAGNVKADTRGDRIEERKEFVLLASKHRMNSVARSVLKSYNAAITDPPNELMHLEQTDLLKTRYATGSHRQAFAEYAFCTSCPAMSISSLWPNITPGVGRKNPSSIEPTGFAYSTMPPMARNRLLVPGCKIILGRWG